MPGFNPEKPNTSKEDDNQEKQSELQEKQKRQKESLQNRWDTKQATDNQEKQSEREKDQKRQNELQNKWDTKQLTDNLLKLTKNNAIELDGSHQNENGIDLEVGEWNEDDGVIIFNKHGSTYATPATEQVREILNALQYQKDEEADVPNFNQKEEWNNLEAFEG